MQTPTLTQRLKTLYFPKLLRRDNGFNCWYCKVPLFLFKYIFEHLNNNREDNRIENLVIACSTCNNKKTNDPIMQEKAMQKLTQNEQSNVLRERKNLVDEFTKEGSIEIEINVTNSEITEQFITERVTVDGYVLFSDALYCSVFLCKQKTGHGSPQSVRNYIKTLTCEIAPFKIMLDNRKRKIIVRRSEN